MSNDKNISLKPLSEYHTYFLVTLLTFPFLLDLSAIICKEIALIKGLIIYRLSIIALFIIIRLFIYNIKFTVNSECLTKTKGRKVIFKVDVKDIEAIFIKKASKFNVFKLWGFFLLCFICESGEVVYNGARGTDISIVYKESSVCLEEKQELSRISLKPETMKDFFEHNEILSYKKCMRMCEVLGIEPQIVHLNKHKTAK